MNAFRFTAIAFAMAFMSVAPCSAFAVNDLFERVAKTEAVKHSVPGVVVVVREWPIAPNVREIVADARARKTIDVVFPNHSTIAFALTRFEARTGFNKNGDPNPNLADSKLSYSWEGSSEGREMTLDVERGKMSAKIQAGGARLYVVSNETGQPLLREYDRTPNESIAALETRSDR